MTLQDKLAELKRLAEAYDPNIDFCSPGYGTNAVALVAYHEAVKPSAILTLIREVRELKAERDRLAQNQRTPGTVEVCERYVFHDCVNHRGHLQWKYGASACTYGTCPRSLVKAFDER